MLDLRSVGSVGALVAAAFSAAVLFAGCGGTSAEGEACDTPGVEEECDVGAVCGTDDRVDPSGPVCLHICDGDGDCRSDEECNGVEGTSLKGCRVKDGGGGKGK